MNLMTARQVRELVGHISEMTLWRWLHDERLGFPQPIFIQRRRYWRDEELQSWLDEQMSRSLKNGGRHE